MPQGLDALRAQTRSLLEPVSVASPAGTHDPDDALYLKLADAVARLDSPSAASIDWGDLARTAAELLEKRNKDLLAASLFAWASYRARGLAGLALGCVALADLMDGYWSSLHPPVARTRARGNAMRVFLDRVVREAPPRDPDAETDAELVILAGAAVDELSRRVEQLFPEESSAVEALSRWYDDQVRTRARWSRPVPLEERETVIEIPPEVSHAETLAARANAARASLPSLLGALFETASALRRADASDPRPYRLLRAAVWLDALAAPAADSTGRTRSAPPLRSLREFVTRASDERRFRELLDECEQSLRVHPLWLDAQRYSALALENLGPEFTGARAAIEQEVRALLLRLPDVTSLRFDDGTPFGDDETLAWIEQIRRSNSR